MTPLQDEECFLGASILPVFAAFTPRHKLQGPCRLLQGVKCCWGGWRPQGCRDVLPDPAPCRDVGSCPVQPVAAPAHG